MDALERYGLWIVAALLCAALAALVAARRRLRARRQLPDASRTRTSPALPPARERAEPPPGGAAPDPLTDAAASDGETSGGPEPRSSVAIIVPRETPRHAVVFAHGWMGADRIGLPGLRQEYFRGVGQHLRARGFDVHFLRVSAAASVERRANQLAEQVARLRGPVNIIAHSMGGLDARYAISLLGLDRHVVSLTTVGTPHLGTPIADVVVDRLGSVLRLRAALEVAGVDIEGLYDLTTARMGAFNRVTVDAGRVEYRSVIGRVPRGKGRVHALLTPSFSYLHRAVGDNDGLVPAQSQHWGEVSNQVDADHWAQIGWSGGFDARLFYAQIVRDLARRGL